MLDDIEKNQDDIDKAIKLFNDTIKLHSIGDLDVIGQDYFAQMIDNGINTLLENYDPNTFVQSLLDLSDRVNLEISKYIASDQKSAKIHEDMTAQLVAKFIETQEEAYSVALDTLQSSGLEAEFYGAYQKYISYLGDTVDTRYMARKAVLNGVEGIKSFIAATDATLAFERLKPFLPDLKGPEAFDFLAGEDGIWSQEENDLLSEAVQLFNEGKISANEFMDAIESGSPQVFEEMIKSVGETEQVLSTLSETVTGLMAKHFVKLRSDAMFFDELIELRDAYQKAYEDSGADDAREAINKILGGYGQEMSDAMLKMDGNEF
jgi:hypothetical protein